MKFLGKYLKPFLVIVLIIFLLQICRTYGELELPNVMSDLVNIGIQYEGFEEKAPNEIPNNGMNILINFIEDKDSFFNAYTFDDNVYKLKEDHHSKQLDKIYVTSCYAALNCYQTITGDQDDINISHLYNFIPTYQSLSDTELKSYIEYAQAIQDVSSIAGQVSVSFSKYFSEELGYDTHQVQMDYIWHEAKIMFFFMIFVLVTNATLGLCVTWLATGLVTNIRQDFFNKVISFSNSEYDKFSVASLITRSTNDVQQILSLVIMILRLFLFSILMAIGALVMAIQTSKEMCWIPGITVAALLFIIGILNAIVLPKFKTIQKLVDRVNQLSRESLKGILVIRAFRNEKHTEKEFETTNNELRLTNRFTQRALAMMGPSMMLLMNGCSLLIIWIGADAIAASTISVGSLMAYIQYATHIVMSFMMVASMFIIVPRAMVSINRINEVLTTEPCIKDKDNAITINRSTGKIEFQNVSFRFNNATRNALNNLSFTIEPGKTTAIIGSTGSGKSTLVNLISRLYDSTDGQILLDGINIKDITLESLRNNIGYVPQKGMLFQGTFESNLRIGKEDATQEEIDKALEISQAKDFVYASENGLQTEVSQGGTSVSGGQRQRLSIARAIIKNAPINIFDDSFSALDLKTDSALRKALKENLTNNTMIIVAQRISTIIDADQIIVLDEGKIVGIGKHEYLLEKCLTYREIAESQLNKGGQE